MRRIHKCFPRLGLPSARREGRGLSLTPLQKLVAGYAGSTGAVVGASAKTFVKIAGRAGYDAYTALVALGTVSEMLRPAG